MRSFSSPDIRPCSAATLSSDERTLLQLWCQFLDRGQPGPRRNRIAVLVHVRLVDHPLLGDVARDPWAHDVHLMPLRDLFAHPLPDPIDPVRLLGKGYDVGLDVGTSGRQLRQRRHLKIPEDRHRHAPRDRRRRHHQHVRRRASLVRQRRPLLHSEAVLLIHDDEAEIGETDTILEQGMGADDDARRTTRGIEQRLTLLGLAHRTGQQCDRGPIRGPAEHAALGKVTQQTRDRPVVLLGQNLRRRQQAQPDHRNRSPATSPSARRQSFRTPLRPEAADSSGVDQQRSAKISALTSCWPAVRVNGSRESNSSSSPPSRPSRAAAPRARISARRRANTSWVIKASSNR